MRTIQAQPAPGIEVTILIGRPITAVSAQILPVRFVSSIEDIQRRTARAGHDADAQKAERFPAGAA